MAYITEVSKIKEIHVNRVMCFWCQNTQIGQTSYTYKRSLLMNNCHYNMVQITTGQHEILL